jgi:hypothetical protein
MTEFTINNGILKISNTDFNYPEYRIEDDSVIIRLVDEICDFEIVVLPFDVTINDVLQTSAQMIYDTLTSNV